MEQANKLVVEAGYKSPKLIGTNLGVYSEVLLDPQWWLCLGKAMGWKDLSIEEGEYDPSSRYASLGWEEEWHCFIAHLAEEKPPEDFFNTLINEKNKQNSFSYANNLFVYLAF